jgi:hypothetical protein
MPTTYLIKRSPDYTKNGIIVKRTQKSKGYSESRINIDPFSNKLNEGDEILVAETDHGIYAKGIVRKINKVVEFRSVDHILSYYKDNKLKDSSYWMSLIQKLTESKKKNPDSVLKYQEYFIDQKMLEKVLPFSGSLACLKKIQISIYKLKAKELENIINPPFQGINSLTSKIPNSLRLDLYSLFNHECKISTWVDIDHFVPQSLGGPGNIPENLIPVGLSLNRYKGNSIPIGLFVIANEYKNLKKYCNNDNLKKDRIFLRDNEAKDKAEKIISEVKRFSIEEARSFFKKVLNYHHPEYVKIIENFYV